MSEDNYWRSRAGVALAAHFFSTFHKNVTGATITPDRLDRYAVGKMNWAVGMYGRNLKASSCTASAAFLLAVASVVLNHASRSSSSRRSAGHPNHALSPE